jgi:hypothetical protein
VPAADFVVIAFKKLQDGDFFANRAAAYLTSNRTASDATHVELLLRVQPSGKPLGKKYWLQYGINKREGEYAPGSREKVVWHDGKVHRKVLDTTNRTSMHGYHSYSVFVTRANQAEGLRFLELQVGKPFHHAMYALGWLGVPLLGYRRYDPRIASDPSARFTCAYLVTLALQAMRVGFASALSAANATPNGLLQALIALRGGSFTCSHFFLERLEDQREEEV